MGVIGKGFFIRAPVKLGNPPVIIGFRIFGGDLKGTGIILYRPFIVLIVEPGPAPVFVGFGIIGIEFEGLGIIRDGAFEIAREKSALFLYKGSTLGCTIATGKKSKNKTA